jgi:hypothetical protein
MVLVRFGGATNIFPAGTVLFAAGVFASFRLPSAEILSIWAFGAKRPRPAQFSVTWMVPSLSYLHAAERFDIALHVRSVARSLSYYQFLMPRARVFLHRLHP